MKWSEGVGRYFVRSFLFFVFFEKKNNQVQFEHCTAQRRAGEMMFARGKIIINDYLQQQVDRFNEKTLMMHTRTYSC